MGCAPYVGKFALEEVVSLSPSIIAIKEKLRQLREHSQLFDPLGREDIARDHQKHHHGQLAQLSQRLIGRLRSSDVEVRQIVQPLQILESLVADTRALQEQAAQQPHSTQSGQPLV